MPIVPQRLFHEAVHLLHLPHALERPSSSTLSQHAFHLLFQHRRVLGIRREVEDRVRDQLARRVHRHGADPQLRYPVEVSGAPVWLRNDVAKPFDGVVGLFVLFDAASLVLLFLGFSLLDERREELARSSVAGPDGEELGDEMLNDGAEPRVEESEFRRGEEDVFCVLW